MTSLFAYLSYRDAPAAIDWLEAIGFRVLTRQPANDGSILYAELRLGDAVVMLSTADADYTMPPLVGRSTGSGLYLLVDDVDTIHAAASAAGATAVLVPERPTGAPSEPACSNPTATNGHSAPTTRRQLVRSPGPARQVITNDPVAALRLARRLEPAQPSARVYDFLKDAVRELRRRGALRS